MILSIFNKTLGHQDQTEASSAFSTEEIRMIESLTKETIDQVIHFQRPVHWK